jgi:ribonuclease III
MDEPLRDLQQRLGVTFRDPELLELSLTHRSFAFEAGGLPTNERLEFLGDAVVGLVVTDVLYRRFPEAPEGRLAKVRAAAVNTRSLAALARDLDLGDHVRLGRGEEQSGGRNKESILADTFEAVVGAVYVDRGIRTASSFVRRLFRSRLADLAAHPGSLDYKTSLQELTAGALGTLPAYDVTEEGPDHDKRFRAVAMIAGDPLGTGAGRSKKEAEQAAAEEAYLALQERLQDPEEPLLPGGEPSAAEGTDRDALSSASRGAAHHPARKEPRDGGRP